MGLFSSLSKFGLEDMSAGDVFREENKKDKAPSETVEEAKQDTGDREENLIVEKHYTCNLCGMTFKNTSIINTKAKYIGLEMDLRPRYENVDVLKYDIVVCPHCGNSALRNFRSLTDTQKGLIRQNISPNFHYREPRGVLTYDEALERYQLALACAVAAKRKSSEKAYLCLKMAWVIRGKAENLDKENPEYDYKLNECEENEIQAMRLALDGFITALQNEYFPIAGLNEPTFYYIVAALSFKLGETDNAARFLSQVISSREASGRLKDKAKELKNEILALRKG